MGSGIGPGRGDGLAGATTTGSSRETECARARGEVRVYYIH